jgi:hypothetical protein
VYGWSIEWITIVDAGGGGGLDVSAEMEIWNLDHEFDNSQSIRYLISPNGQTGDSTADNHMTCRSRSLPMLLPE